MLKTYGGKNNTSTQMCTHLRVDIHPHLNRVDSEIAVKCDKEGKKIKPALKPSNTTVAV